MSSLSDPEAGREGEENEAEDERGGDRTAMVHESPAPMPGSHDSRWTRRAMRKLNGLPWWSGLDMVRPSAPFCDGTVWPTPRRCNRVCRNQGMR